MNRRTILYLPVLALLVVSCHSKQIPQAVDMGLSVKWATCNIGADTPAALGDYYAWGEIVSKNDYSWSTYSLCRGENPGRYFTKYCTIEEQGVLDNLTVLNAVDDVASCKLGKNWRMPTIEEWAELMAKENCIWAWTTQENTNGYLVTSKRTGNSIFLPATGRRLGVDVYSVNGAGNYWSSSLGGATSIAKDIFFFSDYKSDDSSERRFGLSVRPVCDY